VGGNGGIEVEGMAGLTGLNKMFQSLGTELERTVISVTKDLARERDMILAWKKEVENSARALEEEKQLMQERVGTMEEIIDLNVGGMCFTTTRTTLCSVKGSMLEAMFSGRWQLPTDKKGRYFIDR
jgi:hypothetical protein